jgi:hypothetical protein
LHEKPYYPFALKTLLRKHRVPLSELWPVVGGAWSSMEFPSSYAPFWRRVWSSTDPKKRNAMDADEQAMFDALPETVVVWRGVDDEIAVEGLSWTLERDIAIFFAKRFQDPNTESFLARLAVRARHCPLSSTTARTSSQLRICPGSRNGPSRQNLNLADLSLTGAGRKKRWPQLPTYLRCSLATNTMIMHLHSR